LRACLEAIPHMIKVLDMAIVLLDIALGHCHCDCERDTSLGNSVLDVIKCKMKYVITGLGSSHRYSLCSPGYPHVFDIWGT
jgi:hypothetical protein